MPAAGSGLRAGVEIPKQYVEIGGRSMLLRSLEALAGVARIERILVVVAPDDRHIEGLGLPPRSEVSRRGGASRAESVAGGLQALAELGAGDEDWVLVHDAARCLVTSASIDALVDACLPDAVGGLLAHKLADTLKRAQDGRVAATVDRSDKWLAQTPQMFRLGLLRRALESARAAGVAVTDEASAIESMGGSPLLVEGGAGNFKITYKEDFLLAAALLVQRESAEASVARAQGAST